MGTIILTSLLAISAAVFASQPAVAAPIIEKIDGIEYTVDDGNILAGATVTSFSGTDMDVSIPDSVTIGGDEYVVLRIADSVFSGLPITSVELPSQLQRIGSYAFIQTHLTEVSIPDSVTWIGQQAFYYAPLESAYIPDTVSFIGSGAFAESKLAAVNIPNNLTVVEISAFSVNNLTSLTLPHGITHIKNYAFSANYITQVTIPASVEEIGSWSFNQLRSGVDSLTEVIFEGDAPTIMGTSETYPSFGDATGKVLYYYPGATGFTTPQWEGYNTMPVSYTVYFSPNDGNPAEELPVVHGEVVGTPTTPVREGFTGSSRTRV